MTQIITTLALVEFQPLTAHPALVYLSALSPGSRRTMRQSLNAIASILTSGQCDATTLNWAALSYQHTAALRAVLSEKYAPTTANKMLSALRRVLLEARRLGLMDAEDYARAADIKDIKGSRLLRGRALSTGEMAALLEACRSDPTPSGVRDAALMAILRAGLRRSEVVGLNLEDFDYITGALTIRDGKGGRERITYLPHGAISTVNSWLVVRGVEPGALLCPVNKVGRVTVRRLSDQAVLVVLQKRQKQAGVAAFSPHDFRRTFISDLLDAGADIVTVQKLVGHSKPETTAKYDRRGELVKRKAVDLLEWPPMH